MEITAQVIVSFRESNPKFTSDTIWPDSVITIALCKGDAETGSCRWGAYADDCRNFKQRGMFAYAAHWLATNYPTASGATTPENTSGSALYSANSKSVGDESISFDTGKTSELNAGDVGFASTLYGQEWLRLRKRAGMGALAV